MKQYVIIGNSAAGIAAAEAIRKLDREAKVIMVSDEDYPAYCRCLISYYLSGEVKEDKLTYRPEAFYKENNIELFLNKKVMRVDPKKSRIVCEDKTQINYDQLLIASGSRPKFPDTKGIKKKGVFGLRTIKDAKDIEGTFLLTRSACVLGGGLVGLKAAYGLRKRGLEVKVVIKSRQILSQMLDADAARLLQQRLEAGGIELILGQDVTEVIGNGEMKAIKLDSGKAIECSLLVVGKGVEPNTDLVKETEIKTGTGIIADSLLQTSVPGIFSAGDVCESLDISTGEYSLNALWPVAVEQGRIAGSNMAGANTNYDGSLGMNSIEFFGMPVVSLGVYKIKGGSGGFEELKVIDPKGASYKKLILKGNFLVGAVLAGDIKTSGVFLRLIRERIDVSPFKDKLLQVNFGFPDIMDFVKSKENIYV